MTSSGLNVFIEFGEGCDPFFPGGECGGKTVDLGPISGLSFPSDLGSFGATPFDDAVVLNDGVAFELRDLVGTPSVTALPGTFDYEEATILNADEFDDVQATGPSGTEFYFGTANGLSGPFAEGGGDSCRAAFSDSLANACGGQALGGDCWCDALCIANLDCCSDFTDTCLVGTDGELLVDAALSIAGELLAAAAETVDPVDNSAPAVSLTTPAAEGHGVFIDEDWILTTSEVVADQELSALAATSFNGTPVPIGASLVNHTQQVALLRATAPTGVVPAGHKLPFCPGSPEELASEASFEVFGSIPSTSGLASTAFAGQRALVRPRTASLRPLDFRLGHSSTLGSDLLVRSGSPVVAQNGFLAGIASSAEANVLRVRDAVSTTVTRSSDSGGRETVRSGSLVKQVMRA